GRSFIGKTRQSQRRQERSAPTRGRIEKATTRSRAGACLGPRVCRHLPFLEERKNLQCSAERCGTHGKTVKGKCWQPTFFFLVYLSKNTQR
ncbi:unnamed protein product, partial [Heterosigma akashiwo]